MSSRFGGRLVIGDLGRWSLWAAVRRVRSWLGAPTWRRAHFATASEWRALMGSLDVRVDGVRGAVYYPPVGAMARLLARADRWLGARTTMGAAFIAVVGTKAARDRRQAVTHHVRWRQILMSPGTATCAVL